MKNKVRFPLLLFPLACLAGLFALLGTADANAKVEGKQSQVFSPAIIEIGGTLVQLEGLRAPGNDQSCTESQTAWSCGRDARWATLNRVGNHWITCLDRGRTASGTFLGLCYLGGVGGPELNAWLVEQGWALTNAAGAERYLEEETKARAERRGLWRNDIEPVWE
ncbi:thermonuclease family protein [Denitrobaculum tricleocarpae]|uniref:Thermonuclease family protein n=1 Tax=Denitrobaculum tricleocarpae TaxID=2591009 RepID=A0A545U308_9PROT|nr:thermonuclease family protein [Denitrobaculum tricleocarpae]TQV83865.1 thermonuclease family protein [Denitrobaculum tricleocarpae]